MTTSLWKGRRVMVTGHTGFKGGWLSLALASRGADVLGYALAPPTQPSFFATCGLGDVVKSELADVRDLNRLTDSVKSFRPEIVFHAAAQSLVRPSYDDPVGTYETNVMGSVNVLEAVRRTESVRAVVMITSDKCYENRERTEGYREDEAMGGRDPYSSSKGCAELVTAAYRSSFFAARPYRCAVASARAGNVIGGGDWAQDRLVPDILRSLVAGKAAAIRNPQAVRPWQHVLECIEGYVKLAEALWVRGEDASEPWNFGPDDAEGRPVSWIADATVELWGQGAAWKSVPEAGAAKHEAKLLNLDSSKARAQLGWKPRLSIREALAWTVDWHRSFAAGADMRAESLRQIDHYGRLAVA